MDQNARGSVLLNAPGSGPSHGAPCCPICGSGLDLFLPDLERPDLLLGVCQDCHAWHLLNDVRGLIGTIDLTTGRIAES